MTEHITADLLLNERGRIALMIEPKSTALAADYLTVLVDGQMQLTTTNGQIYDLGRAEPKMRRALSGLQEIILLQILDDGEEVLADELPIRHIAG